MSTGQGRRAPLGARSDQASNGTTAIKLEGQRTPRNGSSILHEPRLPGRRAVVPRFGPILGRRFSRTKFEILAHAHAAYTGLKKAQRTIRGRGANIFTQWIGDPDALGSAVLLKAVLMHLGAKEVRILTGALGHPQTR